MWGGLHFKNMIFFFLLTLPLILNQELLINHNYSETGLCVNTRPLIPVSIFYDNTR